MSEKASTAYFIFLTQSRPYWFMSIFNDFNQNQGVNTNCKKHQWTRLTAP